MYPYLALLAGLQLREANEEVSLPLPSTSLDEPSHLTFLTTLRPFISLYKLLVTPVVVLLTDPDPQSIISKLSPNAGEVDHIFHHPLEALLDPSPELNPVLSLESGSFSEVGGEDWPYETEWYVRTYSLKVSVLLLNLLVEHD